MGITTAITGRIPIHLPENRVVEAEIDVDGRDGYIEIAFLDRDFAERLIYDGVRNNLVGFDLNYVCVQEREPEEYHDEDTMFKVREALHMLDEHEYIDAINSMQNAGILFRERK